MSILKEFKAGVQKDLLCWDDTGFLSKLNKCPFIKRGLFYFGESECSSIAQGHFM